MRYIGPGEFGNSLRTDTDQGRATDPALRSEVARATLIGGVLLLALFALFTWRRNSTPVVLCGYLAIFAAGWLAHRLQSRSSGRVRAATVSMSAVALATCLFAMTDVRVERWESEAGLIFIDTHSRFSRTPLYREILDRSSLSSFEGPLAETGKPHGKWVMFNSSTLQTTYHFYWYGEDVSEGEWHLRNR